MILEIMPRFIKDNFRTEYLSFVLSSDLKSILPFLIKKFSFYFCVLLAGFDLNERVYSGHFLIVIRSAYGGSFESHTVHDHISHLLHFFHVVFLAILTN